MTLRPTPDIDKFVARHEVLHKTLGPVVLRPNPDIAKAFRVPDEIKRVHNMRFGRNGVYTNVMTTVWPKDVREQSLVYWYGPVLYRLRVYLK